MKYLSKGSLIKCTCLWRANLSYYKYWADKLFTHTVRICLQEFFRLLFETIEYFELLYAFFHADGQVHTRIYVYCGNTGIFIPTWFPKWEVFITCVFFKEFCMIKTVSTFNFDLLVLEQLSLDPLINLSKDAIFFCKLFDAHFQINVDDITRNARISMTVFQITP